MSTDYTVKPRLDFDKLCRALPAGRLRIAPDPPSGADPGHALVLTLDGENFLWARRETDGGTWLVRYGLNQVEPILVALEREFGVEIVSDDTPRP